MSIHEFDEIDVQADEREKDKEEKKNLWRVGELRCYVSPGGCTRRKERLDVVLATLVDIPPPEAGETAGSTRIGYCELPTIYIRAGTLSFSYFPYLAYYPLFNFRRFIDLLAWSLTMGNSRVINPW